MIYLILWITIRPHGLKFWTMEDWANRLDGFLEFNGTEILTGTGKISAEQAEFHAETEFEKYRIIQDRLFVSDFDKYFVRA